MRALADIQKLAAEKAALEQELSLYADNDPAQIEQVQNLIALMKEAAILYTDNIYILESYLKKDLCRSDYVTSIKAMNDIPEEIEDIQ